MIYLAGVGKDYEAIIDEVSGWNYILLDADLKKIGCEFYGRTVQDYSILRNAQKEDKVFITSKKYYIEISKTVRGYNSEVEIMLLPEYIWKQKALEIPDILNHVSSYDVTIPIQRWIEAAVQDEVNYWKEAAVKAKDVKDSRLYERFFTYPWDDSLELKNGALVVDIGCGPLPKFGNKLRDGKINYHPVDPLAHQYKKMLRNNEIQLPVTPEFAMAELLSLFFLENSADYIIIHNALDHTYDIMRALIEMLRALKIGGRILMFHMDSEGIFEGYSGMHQWNITEHSGDLYFFDKETGINVTQTISEFADVIVKRRHAGYRDEIIVTIKKEKDVPAGVINRYDKGLVAGELISALFERMA